MKSEQLLSLCQRHHAILLKSDGQTIVIAVVDTPAPELMEALRFATQKRIDIECWSRDRMDKHQHEAQQSASESATGNTRGVTDLLNQILEQALRQRASDIHIERRKNSCGYAYVSMACCMPCRYLRPRWLRQWPHGLRCWATSILPSIVSRRMDSSL